jgi:hypothetical protein
MLYLLVGLIGFDKPYLAIACIGSSVFYNIVGLATWFPSKSDAKT